MATLCVRSATLAVCNVFWISTPRTLRPWICSPSCATTTSSWGPGGQGVQRDYVEAMKWTRKAADQGLVADDVRQSRLGDFAREIGDVPRPVPEAGTETVSGGSFNIHPPQHHL